MRKRFPPRLVIIAACLAAPALGVRADERAPPRPLRIAVYSGEGTSKSVQNVLKVLQDLPHIEEKVLVEDITAGRLEEFDVVVHPGGSGSRQARALGEKGREQVRRFVEEGGGYVGVCAGAYLATCDYEWSLNILDAKVVDRKHWARGFGNVDIGLSDKGRQLLDADCETLTIYYHQGPLLAPADNPDIEDYEPLAIYKGEIAKKGAPRGVMPGTTAIAAGRHGDGRVICFSPHPERTPGWEKLLVRGVTWAAGDSRPEALSPVSQ